MPVRVRYITDPGSDASWAIEPQLRKLSVEFGDEVDFTYVMGGLAREYGQDQTGEQLVAWTQRAAEGGMPIDPLLWREGPIHSTYPACMAVKAAAEQGKAGDYLRALREGLMCFRRKLDTAEALVEEARRAGLDVERFRIDLESHAIVEAFGADLEEARAAPEVVLPTLRFGEEGWVFGEQPYEAYREAAIAAGAAPLDAPPPGVLEALVRFGRMATREIELVCDLAGPQRPGRALGAGHGLEGQADARDERLAMGAGVIDWTLSGAIAPLTTNSSLHHPGLVRRVADYRGAGVALRQELDRRGSVGLRDHDDEAAAHVEDLVHLVRPDFDPREAISEKIGGTGSGESIR